jgi:tetratricopeptide (TPR) repeat protein
VTDIDALIGDAMEFHQAGKLAEAETAYKKALAANPKHAGVLHNLGVIAAGTGRAKEAIGYFDRAISVDPGYASAHFNKAVALRALGKLDAALAGYGQAVALAPDHYEAHLALGFLWNARGRRDRALDHFARTLELRRGADDIGLAYKSFQSTTPAKLRHDAEQFRYLAARAKDPMRFETLARLYEGVEHDLNGGEPVNVVRLDDDQIARLGETYNAPFHVIDAPEGRGPAVNPELDAAAITGAYRANAPGVAWFDDLLSERALALLQRFLLQSTIWFDYAHIGGFLAAYLEDGLASPLILQIADELRAALPDIFKDHALSQIWAFKAIDAQKGIDLHADDGAVSVNFWVTPDSANLDPDHGGLVVYTKETPAEWRLTSYDDDRDAIRAHLADAEDSKIVIPYRENRAVIFDSRLFHGSDAVSFAPGYENHRINVTMMFGTCRPDV